MKEDDLILLYEKERCLVPLQKPTAVRRIDRLYDSGLVEYTTGGKVELKDVVEYPPMAAEAGFSYRYVFVDGIPPNGSGMERMKKHAPTLSYEVWMGARNETPPEPKSVEQSLTAARYPKMPRVFWFHGEPTSRELDGDLLLALQKNDPHGWWRVFIDRWGLEQIEERIRTTQNVDTEVV